MRNLPPMQTTEQLYFQNLLRYDTVHLKRYKLALDYMDEKSMVLDYGCGAGYGSWLMSGEADSVVGVDADETAINYAKTWYARPNITHLLQSIPPEEKFDVVTCFEVMEHVDDAPGLIAKFHSLLKPNGVLVCSVPNEAILPHAASDNHFHKKHYTPVEFDNLLESKFDIEHRYTQRGKFQGELVPGWIGMNLIAVCRKI